jgi:UDP:flavonoid glycosyltransferase YjiC (YdhE family)
MRNAIQELLANGRYRQAAARLQADYVRHNAPEEAARC